MAENNAEEQQISSRVPERLRPYTYRKGQSGNPGGRPKGESLKAYVRAKLSSMTPDQKEEFIDGLNKDTVWEMGEGKAESKTDITTKGDKIVFVPQELLSKFNLDKNDNISDTKPE